MRTFRFAVLVTGTLACNALTGASALDPTLDESAGDGGPPGTRSSGGSSSGTPSGDDGGTTDAATDSSVFDSGKAIEVVDLVDVGTADRSTGLANQAHLVWAPIAQRWMLFYLTSAAASALRTKISTDFVTWKDGGELALPHAHNGDGRNFAVARATIGGKDVFHLAVSFRVAADDRRAYAARGAHRRDARLQHARRGDALDRQRHRARSGRTVDRRRRRRLRHRLHRVPHEQPGRHRRHR